MSRTVFGVALMAACGALQAQTFQAFKDQCIADQRAACAAGKWWRAMPIPRPDVGHGGFPIVSPRSDDAAGYPAIQVADVDRYANYVCGTVAYRQGAEVSGYSGWAAANPSLALALVSAAARIESDCSTQARQLVLVQQMLDIAKDNQQTLKGDIQSILGKLMPGATVTITLPPAKPASAPK